MKLAKFMRKKVQASSIIYNAYLNLRGFWGTGGKTEGRVWHTFTLKKDRKFNLSCKNEYFTK